MGKGLFKLSYMTLENNEGNKQEKIKNPPHGRPGHRFSSQCRGCKDEAKGHRWVPKEIPPTETNKNPKTEQIEPPKPKAEQVDTKKWVSPTKRGREIIAEKDRGKKIEKKKRENLEKIWKRQERDLQ